MRHPLPCRPVEEDPRGLKPMQIDAERLDKWDVLPGRRRLGNLNRSLFHPGGAGRFQRVQPADSS